MKPHALLIGLLASPLSLLAVEIEGVQMASLDQPRVSVALRRDARGEALSAKADAGLAGLLGIKDAPERVSSFAAFLDTGASGISISTQTADALGISRLKADRRDVVFYDVGVGGRSAFNVSEPLHISLGGYQALGFTGDVSTFQPAGGPWHMQVGPLGGGGLLGMITGGIDIVGMPAMAGKIVVIDARPVNTFADTLRVQMIDPRVGGVRIPETHRHIAMSYADFGPYTTIEPANATRPVCTANPFIGPAPIQGAGPAPRPITITHAGRSSSAGWLLDTGAAASIISKRQAEHLGIRYKPSAQGADSTELTGVDKSKQFTLTIAGIGGQKKAAGFFLDELRIPTAEGDDIIYRPAPVLVADISVEDPKTGKTLTLDGVFGMNFLVASAQVTEGLLPDIGKMTEGAFDFIIIDHTRSMLGLSLRKELR